MELIPFIAQSAADAVTQIRDRLGHDAVVVHVRPMPVRGLARLWRKGRFEVLAYRPEKEVPHLDARSDSPAVPDPAPEQGEEGGPLAMENRETPAAVGVSRHATSEMASVLEGAGLTAANAYRVIERMPPADAGSQGASLVEGLASSRAALAGLWRRPPPLLPGSVRPHVLVGPPGVGKTTCLCKWLTQIVLVEGGRAKVTRLDGARANTADALEIHCQALGVPVDRSWRVDGEPESVVHFIDLPGVDWRDPKGLQELARQLRGLMSPQIHLVLNGAYETRLLLEQARAFGVLPIEDMVLTHLDEEPRWGRLWNLVLGTNFPIRFLSAGQNIPGDFLLATPERLFTRQFPS